MVGAKVGRRKAQAEKQHGATLQPIAKNPAKDDAGLCEQVIQNEKEGVEIQETLAAYHENLPGIADEIHPFSVLDNSRNGSENIISGLEKRAQAFEKLAKSQKIADSNRS